MAIQRKVIRLAPSIISIASRKTFVFVRGRDVRRDLLDVVGGVAHGEGNATLPKHREIILHVADGGDGVRRDAQAPGHGLYEGAFVAVRAG